MRFVANSRQSVDHHMRIEPNAVAQLHIVTDRAKWSDITIASDFGIRTNDRGFVYEW